MRVQTTGLQQPLPTTLFDKPTRQSKWCVVETVHWSDKLNERSSWQVQSTRTAPQTKALRTDLVNLTDKLVLKVTDE